MGMYAARNLKNETKDPLQRQLVKFQNVMFEEITDFSRGSKCIQG